MFGHRRADGNAVSEQRKSQPSDQPHPCQLREKHFACVVDEHADAGDQPKQSAVLIGFDLRGAKKAVEHVGDSFLMKRQAASIHLHFHNAIKIMFFHPKVKNPNKTDCCNKFATVC